MAVITEVLVYTEFGSSNFTRGAPGCRHRERSPAPGSLALREITIHPGANEGLTSLSFNYTMDIP